MSEYSKEFEEYLKANKDKGFADDVIEEAKKELRVEEMEYERGRTAHLDEPDREIVVASYPKGEVFETDMSEAELHQAIKDLKEAREILVKYLEKSTADVFKDTQTTTLLDVKDRLQDFPADLGDAIGTMARYNVDDSLSLFEVPGELEDVIGKYRIAAEHLHKKAA